MTTTKTALLSLWTHIYGDQTSYLGLFSGIREADSKLQHTREKYIAWPAAATNAEGWLEQEAAAGREVYYCVHLLTDRKRVKENAAPILALWADIDGATIPDDLPAPTALIASSPGRLQGYWRLTRTIDPERAEDLNKRLAYVIGADASGYDLTQLLRPPGMPNRKYADAPRVQLFELHEDEAYDPDQLDVILPPAPKRAQRPRTPMDTPCTSGAPVNDDEVLARLWDYPGDKGARIRRLWSGDSRDYPDADGNPDESRGDLALCNYLADAAGDSASAKQTDRLFRLSERVRDKWDERHYADGATYGQETIHKAITRTRLVGLDTAVRSDRRPAENLSESPTEQVSVSVLLARIEALEATVARLEAERDEWRARFERSRDERSIEARIRRNKTAKAVADPAIAAYHEYRASKVDEHGFARLPLATVAAKTGRSAGTVSAAIDRVAAAGLMDRDLRTEHARDGTLQKVTYIRIREPETFLEELAETAIPPTPEHPKTWGGVRFVCPDHPAASIVKRTSYHCSVCNREIDRAPDEILTGGPSGQVARSVDEPTDSQNPTPHYHTYIDDSSRSVTDDGAGYPPFEPSADWQELPEDYPCPPGVEFRGNITTGRRQARWPHLSTNHCVDCGAPCGGGERCPSCAAAATPIRGRRSA